LLSYPLHFQADLARNILGLRGALRNSPIGAGLIGRSRRATDVGLHSDSPLLKQPFRYIAPVLIPLAPIP